MTLVEHFVSITLLKKFLIKFDLEIYFFFNLKLFKLMFYDTLILNLVFSLF